MHYFVDQPEKELKKRQQKNMGQSGGIGPQFECVCVCVGPRLAHLLFQGRMQTKTNSAGRCREGGGGGSGVICFWALGRTFEFPVPFQASRRHNGWLAIEVLLLWACIWGSTNRGGGQT